MTAARLTPTREALLRAIAAGKVRSVLGAWWMDDTSPWHPADKAAFDGLAVESEPWFPDARTPARSVVLTDAGRALLAQADAR